MNSDPSLTPEKLPGDTIGMEPTVDRYDAARPLWMAVAALLNSEEPNYLRALALCSQAADVLGRLIIDEVRG